MPKSNHASFPCPNCNTVVEKNYCPQCGQPAHLHDGSFWSMMMHFFAHYLHYESKFLQTLKMVMFKPGRATMDFKEKKRARHVEPMSLYIFVVVSYFIASSLLSDLYLRIGVGAYSPSVIAQEQTEAAARKADIGVKEDSKLKKTLGAEGYDKIQSVLDGSEQDVNRKMAPLAPKIFFFLVPVYALLLSLFFIYKKGYTFIEHTVFSIHVHTFWFVMQLGEELISIIPTSFLSTLSFILLLIYTTIAQVRFYKTNWVYASLVSIIAFCLYIIAFGAVTLGVILLLF